MKLARLFLGLACVSPCAFAQTLLTVVNPSFEDTTGTTSYNEFTFGEMPGWQLYDPHNITNGGVGPDYWLGTLNPSMNGTPGNYVNFPNGVPHGVRTAIAFSYAGSDGVGSEWGLEQTLSDVLTANTHYSLTVAIGNIASGVSLDLTDYNLNGFPGYRIELLAGGEVIAFDENSLGGTISEGEFADATVTFTTGASHERLGQVLGIRLINLNIDDLPFEAQDLEVDFDHVRLTASAIPEPSTWALIGGLAALGFAVTRRRLTAFRG